MKITVQINGKDTEIELTEEQVASIEAQSKPKKFQFKYPAGETYLVQLSCIADGFAGSDDELVEHGRYRLTQEAAEMSLARNKRANRLEALAEQLGGLMEYSQKGYFILRDYNCNKWKYGHVMGAMYPEIVYMTQECAIEICRMLNEGEFEL